MLRWACEQKQFYSILSLAVVVKLQRWWKRHYYRLLNLVYQVMASLEVLEGVKAEEIDQWFHDDVRKVRCMVTPHPQEIRGPIPILSCLHNVAMCFLCGGRIRTVTGCCSCWVLPPIVVVVLRTEIFCNQAHVLRRLRLHRLSSPSFCGLNSSSACTSSALLFSPIASSILQTYLHL